MRVRIDQLASHLQQGLKPLYLISGDEPLQVMEASDAIRARARQQGFSEREVLHAEGGFDWNALNAACGSLSLFAEQRLLELRLPGGKPGKEGGAALSEYAANPPSDTLLLIISGKIDSASQKSKWFKALDAAGVILQVWPVDPGALPGWVMGRMRSRGMQPTAEAAQLLAERVEGNLLAAAQEIEKLRLLFDQGGSEATPIDIAQVEEGVADSARYDIFELVDTALLGDAARTARVIEGLRAEGVEPILVLWALLREIRTMAQMAGELAEGGGLDAILGQYRVWDKRKGPVRAGLQRHTVKRWLLLVRRAGRIDRMIKGVEPGNPWDELLQLALLMAGVRTV